MAFRLKMKVLMLEGKQYMVSHCMYAYPGAKYLRVFAMSDEKTIECRMEFNQYNKLDYHYFEDVGPAPHGGAWQNNDSEG